MATKRVTYLLREVPLEVLPKSPRSLGQQTTSPYSRSFSYSISYHSQNSSLGSTAHPTPRPNPGAFVEASFLH